MQTGPEGQNPEHSQPGVPPPGKAYQPSEDADPFDLKREAFGASLRPQAGKERHVEPVVSPSGGQPRIDSAQNQATRPRTFFVRMLRTALHSPSFWSGVGAAVVCIGQSLAGVVLFSAAAAWSLLNETRAHPRTPQAITLQAERHLKPASGIRGFVSHLAKSPGVNLVIGAINWTISSAEAVLRGNFIKPFAFMSFAQGYLVSTMLVNKGYGDPDRKPSFVERCIRTVARYIPDRVKTVLKDPGPWFGLGNIILGPTALAGVRVGAQPLGAGLMLAGIAVAGIGLIKGLMPLWSKAEKSNPSGSASYMNAISNISMGCSAYILGNPFMGLAYLCWGWANCLFGRALDREHVA